tara:strand:+ start:2729 stop:3046 length:318 start_codon:yes stop_codon:yes gene_type:complete
MNRRQFTNILLSSSLVLLPVLFQGCGSPSPDEVEEEQENCEHEWEKASSGETRCKKCGIYQENGPAGSEQPANDSESPEAGDRGDSTEENDVRDEEESQEGEATE